MRTRVAAVLALTLIASRSDAFAQDVDAGRKAFESRCARCHGGDGNGGEMGLPIAQRLPPPDDQALSKLIHEGIPAKGMPPSVINDQEVSDLIRFLRTIERRADDNPHHSWTLHPHHGRRPRGPDRRRGFRLTCS